MLIVEVRHGKIEKALKMMRRKTIKTKLLPTLRKNRNYIKKSERRRIEIQKAQYRQWKTDQED
jgi:small subunit ribosomal protein S21